MGSPFYVSLLESAASDLEAGGPVWDVLDGYEIENESAALALRLMAAVHRLVLDETLPELAPHYPSVGGDGENKIAVSNSGAAGEVIVIGSPIARTQQVSMKELLR